MQSWTSPLRNLALAVCTIGLLAGSADAQVSAGGSPKSFSRTFSQAVPTFNLPVPDVAAFMAEDTMDKDQPYRFGAPIDVDIDLASAGEWTDLGKEGRVWRLRLLAPGAHSLNIQYDRFELPVGGEFYVYSDDQSQVIGAFTEFNNREDGTFATQPLAGDAIVLEYFEPGYAEFPGRISLDSVVYGYRNLFGYFDDDRAFGDSGSCNNDVACSVGIPWEGEIRSVAMILTSSGSRICTGALINNTAQDARQYFLTANHCGLSTGSYIFMFNYNSPSCGGSDGPTTDTVQGCTLRASNSDSDVTLVELTEAIPASYGVFYSGWNRVDAAASSACGIHHPSGDVKKISFENNALSSDTWSGTPANSHWRVAAWDDGTTEPGSSGSPLFDPNHRIIGQLHGGQASCTNNVNDYYGKFSLSWANGSSSSSRLIDWLDPLGTGATVLDGYDTQAPPTDPNINLDAVAVNDGVDGDLDPGDTANLVITLLNSGLDATGITGSLSESSAYVTVTDNSGSWSNLNQGASGSNSANPFSITVDPSAPIGSSVTFTLQVSADGGYSNTLNFSLPIGLIIEGFETGDFSAYDWASSGNASWSVQSSTVYEGSYAAKAGTITHNQASNLSLTLDVTEAGNIGFAYSVSSESNYDYLVFYIDGAVQGEWSGTVAWTTASYAVSAGTHTFTWAYEKDGSVSTGSDTAWIDSVTLPPVNVGPPVYPDIDLSNSSYTVSVVEGGMDTATLGISNLGDADLSWSLSFTDTTPASRDMSGSTLTADLGSFSPGSSFTLALSHYNASPDNEWTSNIMMDLPAGVSVTGGGDFTGGSAGSLTYDGTTGDGAVVNWIDPNGGYGQVYPGETATGSISLAVDAGFSGDISIPWTVTGDIWGADPHEISGTIVLISDGPVTPPFLTWNTGSGSIAPAGGATVTLSFDATERTIGTYTGNLTVSSNDPDENPLVLPIVMNVTSAVTDPVTDLVISNGPSSISLSWSAMPGAVAYTVYEKDGSGAWTSLGNTTSTSFVVSAAAPADVVRQYRVTVQY